MKPITLSKSVIYVAGLPRSGSTLLCQLLGMHPDIYSTGHTSPLYPTLHNLRQLLSNDSSQLGQLDVDFDLVYQRMLNVNRSIINGWFTETEKDWVVDKNRAWLMQIDLVNLLDPNFRMVVCVREPAQIYGSIEAQHQKTLLLDFVDQMASLSRYDRANRLFLNKGIVGVPLKAIEALQETSEVLQQRLFYVVFEHLMQEPQEVLHQLYQWLGLPTALLDTQQLVVKPHESDSYYRFKYPHKTRTTISPPSQHPIPERIQTEIQTQFKDFYKRFYPSLLREKS